MTKIRSQSIDNPPARPTRGGLKIVAVSIGLLLLMAGCNFDTSLSRAHSAQEDVYIADPVELPASHTVSLVNEIDGEIIVIVGDTDQIVVDVTASVASDSSESAIIEAETHISLTNKLSTDGNTREIKVFPIDAAVDSQDHVLLHVQVPAGTILSSITNKSGDIQLFGNLGSITATTGNGNIHVMGANGNLTLKTDNGSIAADILPHQALTLTATNGGITITAHDATVIATANNSSIRFNGDFHNASVNQLTTSGNGSIQIALLELATYQVYATSTLNQVISDIPLSTKPPSTPNQFAVCGFIHSAGPYDYHIENTHDHFGRVEVTPALTGTHVYTGLLSSTFYRFDTNQTRVAFYAPQPINIHIYSEPQLSQIQAGEIKIDQDCTDAWAHSEPGQFTLHLRTDKGRIQIHQIIKQP